MKKILSITFALLVGTSSMQSQALTSSTYDYAGVLHNQALDNFVRIFKEKSVSGIDEGVDYVASIHSSFYQSSTLSSADKALAGQFNNSYKYFVIENHFYDYTVTNSNKYFNLSAKAKSSIEAINTTGQINSTRGSVQQILDNSLKQNIIDNYEYNKLVEIESLVNQNKQGTLTTNEFIQRIEDMSGEFNTKGYTVNGTNGHALAMTLSISRYSLNWWKNNPNALKLDSFSIYDNRNNVIAPWVAADVVGAVFGGAISAFASHATTGTC